MNGDTGPGHGPGEAGRPGGHYGGPGPYGGYAGPPGYGPYAGPGRPGGPGGHYGGPGGPGRPGWHRIPQAPKPGVIPLQPLRFGDIIGGVFGTLKRYPKPLYLPLLVIAGISAALFVVLAAVAYAPMHHISVAASDVHDFSPSDTQVAELLGYGGAFLLLAALTLFACYVVSSALSTTVIRHAALGREVTTRQAWDASRPHLWRIALDSLLITAGTILAAMLVLGFGVGVGIASRNAFFLGLLMLLIFPLTALNIYVQVRLILVVPVLVLENERPIAALRRAWRLNEGAWLRSFGIPYVVNLIGSAVVQMVLSPLVAVGVIVVVMNQQSAMTSSTGPNASIGLVGGFYLVVLAISVLASVLTMPLAPLTNGLLYLDRRIRRESLDVALAAELGIDLRPTWPPPYPPQYPAPNVPPTAAPAAAPTPPSDEAPKAPEAPQEPKAPEAPAVPDASDVPDAPADDAPEEP